MRPTMTVKEAREILGKGAKDMSDQEIKTTVKDLETLANFLLERYLAKCPKLKQ